MGKSTNRTTQHRPQRETKAKELSELKSENRSLRKQLTRLRKQLNKVMDVQDHEPDASEVETLNVPQERCEKCGGTEFAKIPIPGGTLIGCKSCKARKVQK